MPKRMILRQLYDPSKAGRAPTVDLVLVHGLNGDPIQTWSSSQEPGSGWPQRLLPEVQPLTRVLSFGYNADIYHNNSAAGIRGNARALLTQLQTLRSDLQATTRPIVFLAHCLGGLIVKQAMAFANAESEHEAVASATKTIIFLGTPHIGADKRRLELLASRLSHFTRNGKASDLIDAIKRDAEDLSEIQEDFCHHAAKYKIVSCYETDKWKGADGLIVDETSAMMIVENELVPVGGDHLTMCHFEEGLEDPDFKRICQLIMEASGEAPTSAQAEELGEGVAGLNGGPAVAPNRFEPTESEDRIDAPTDVHQQVRQKEGATIITTSAVFTCVVSGPPAPAPAPATKTGPELEVQAEKDQPAVAKPRRRVRRFLKRLLD
ncbi:hypothetical protein MAPG_05538 [Magnaporthiopsis poae ATCC 64411]|uniref:DUF676 domain-containing protein n=1 Tax=Magnaporthiopsis poae (strain ATCC 64411 / 73-15) TaxID=644358 RepID=A0A0C4DZN2_MAGP6|nr:hypothetical protein MAPG_05538 [Magnaporthiopsis poae ATCC 64411]